MNYEIEKKILNYMEKEISMKNVNNKSETTHTALSSGLIGFSFPIFRVILISEKLKNNSFHSWKTNFKELMRKFITDD